MDNVFTYQSVKLPDFCRSPKGTTAVFFCEWDKLKAAQNRITGKFKHTSQPVNGTCSIKSFNSIDPVTGVGFKVLMVEVVKPMPARKTRGRKMGQKNKPKGVAAMDLRGPNWHYRNENGGATVMPKEDILDTV